MRRASRGILAVLMLATVGVAATESPAVAANAKVGGGSLPATASGARAQPPGTWTVHNVATSRCLDSNAAGKVYTLACNGGNYQAWYQSSSPPSVFVLVDAATARCLDSNAAGSVYTLPCNYGNYQYWFLVGDVGPTEVVNLATGRCLDSNSAGRVYTLPCNGGSYQRWVVQGLPE